jgi:hypothetical protein
MLDREQLGSRSLTDLRMPLVWNYPVVKRARCLNASDHLPASSLSADATAELTIDVAFFDTRDKPHIDAMTRAAALCNATRVRFWAILRRALDVPGFNVAVLRLPHVAACIYAGLRSLSRPPGTEYLYKALLHHVMPRTIRRLIVLDTDIVMLTDVRSAAHHSRLVHATCKRSCCALVS